MFGLLDSDIEYISGFATKYKEVEKIGIYGSRARDDYRETSDIDIVLYGERIDYEILEQAEEYLDKNSPYPFFVDVQNYENIKDPLFKEQVDNYVKIIAVGQEVSR